MTRLTVGVVTWLSLRAPTAGRTCPSSTRRYVSRVPGERLAGLDELRHLVKPLLRRKLEGVRTGEAAATAEPGELLEGVGQCLDRGTASATMALDDALPPRPPRGSGPGPDGGPVRRTPVRW